ncbi:hypothetical protein [Paracoccus benzoatiresistens]|uniref:Bacteriophage lambda head decoration protein D n=1 Tax=Paracoccus benzoatiresistens TaxID=2997341 RepID=A0ABT4J9Y9_9RHOB|nr:hypothetical protein [Paracoccus sp. EF6]MCZ0963898.1 hypothetical protein [Paracoccus sp. EF6]
MTTTRDACANGTLEILTAADAVLVSIGLSADGGAVAGGVWTLTFDGAATAAGTGAAARAQIKDNAGTVMVSGLTVGATGADVTLADTNISTAQTVTIDAFTVTHA